MKSIFEQSGDAYTLQGDYRLPNLTLPAEDERYIGVWGATPVEIFEATPQSPVLQSAHFWQAPFPPRRYRRTGTRTLFSAGKRTRR